MKKELKIDLLILALAIIAFICVGQISFTYVHAFVGTVCVVGCCVLFYIRETDKQ
jgi:hypothetical protein